ncbi:30S ribosomal protein S4 [Mycoplasmatota bacterium]|nr:30S ribosomal protein S4 [Mycoplasmatota bacterium]
MARYTGPVWKKSRRLGFSTLETGKELQRRPFAPGQHGQKRRGRLSNYGLQLHEKQKVRFTYGLTEKQFRRIFNDATKLPGKAGENFLFLLESRLDSLVYRAGFASTRRQARQLVNHGHITVDGKRVDIPSYRVRPGQTISLREKSRSLQIIKDALEATTSRKEFISYDENKLEVTYVRLPERAEVMTEISENLIVEYYSR